MKSIIALIVYTTLATDVQNSNPPLIVVQTEDATTQFEVALSSEYSLPAINPEWVYSVAVLKGPFETEKYGLRGANGVIIITIDNEYGAEIPKNIERILDASKRPGVLYILQNPKGTAEYPIGHGTGFGLAILETAWIESISVLKGESARQKYDENTTGAVIFRISNLHIRELPEEIRAKLSE